MKIRELHVRGFGRLEDLSLKLDEGLNLVFGQNEAGKTTLSNFIMASMVGLNPEDRDRFKPWYAKEYAGKIVLKRDSGDEEVIEKDFSQSIPSTPVLEGVDTVALRLLLMVSEDESPILEEDRGILRFLLSSRMELTKDAVELKETLRRLETHEEKLNKKLEACSQELGDIESQLVSTRREKDEYIAKFTHLRKLEMRREELEKELRKLEEKLENLRFMKEYMMYKELTSLEQELRETEELLKSKEKYLKMEERDLLEIMDLEERLHKTEEEIDRITERVEKIARRLEELELKDRELSETLKVAQLGSVDEVEIRLTNVRIIKKLLGEKKAKLGELQKLSETTIKNENVLEYVEKNLKSMEESDPRAYEEEIDRLVKEENSLLKTQKVFKFLTILFLAAAAVFASLGFITYYIFFYLTIPLLLSTILTFVKTRKYDEKLLEIQRDRVQAQLQYNRSKKEFEEAKKNLEAVVEHLGVGSVEELLKRISTGTGLTGELGALKDEIEQLEKSLHQNLNVFATDDITTLMKKLEELKRVKIHKLGLSEELKSLENIRISRRETAENLRNSIVESRERLGIEPSRSIQEVMEEIRNTRGLLKKKEDLEKKVEELRGKLPDLTRFEGVSDEDIVKVEESEEELVASIERVKNEISVLDKMIETEGTQLQKMGDVFNRLAELKTRERQIASEVREIKEKMPYLEELKEKLKEKLQEIRNSYVPLFTNRFNEIMERITDEESNIVFDESLNASLVVKGGHFSPDQHLSRATLDQFRFAFSLALYDVMAPPESLPLILDNPFARYDDERLRRVAELVKDLSRERQVILFFSDKRITKHFKEYKTVKL